MAYKCSTDKKISRVFGVVLILTALLTFSFGIEAFPSIFITTTLFAAVGMFVLGVIASRNEPKEDCLID